jgi:hypothetical protein
MRVHSRFHTLNNSLGQALGLGLIITLCSACSSQQVYQGTAEWRVQSCENEADLDAYERCRERARDPRPASPD